MSKYKPLSAEGTHDADAVVVFSAGESDGEVELVTFKEHDDSQPRHRQQETTLASESEVDDNVSDSTKKQLISNEADQREDGTFVDYEAVLKVIGFGLFHLLLLFGNGIALSSDAVEILSVSFVLPVLRDKDNVNNDFFINSWQDGLLSSIVFLGMLIGGYLWGGLADLSGRRRALLMSLTLNGVFGFVSGLSPNFYVLLLFRFVSGIGYVVCLCMEYVCVCM